MIYKKIPKYKIFRFTWNGQINFTSKGLKKAPSENKIHNYECLGNNVSAGFQPINMPKDIRPTGEKIKGTHSLRLTNLSYVDVFPVGVVNFLFFPGWQPRCRRFLFYR